MMCADRATDASERLDRQLAFVRDIDRLKQVLRRTRLLDDSRPENSAEHSWHLAVMALVLGEYAPPGTDLGRVVRMVLVHDLVEIDAGDTWCFDAAGVRGRAAREAAAAERVFASLPDDTADELRALWEEFEAGTSPTARFAIALDRFEPVLQVAANPEQLSRDGGVTREAALERARPIASGAPALWPFVLRTVDAAEARGYLRPAGP